MIKWVIELSEYDIFYQPRSVIKAQTLAKFVNEATLAEEDEVTKKVDNKYEVKEERMKEYLQEIGELSIRLKSFQLHQIPRMENAKADYLAQLDNSQVEIDWRKGLLDYLIEGIFHADEMETARLKSRAAKFSLLNCTLYKRSFSQHFLQCLLMEEKRNILQEIHEGSCGSRMGRIALPNKTLRAG
ncbi:UNVERIFIED_CONTAM: hypothetical protein Sradi_6925600, partial [Sesamum radiatum]